VHAQRLQLLLQGVELHRIVVHTDHPPHRIATAGLQMAEMPVHRIHRFTQPGHQAVNGCTVVVAPGGLHALEPLAHAQRPHRSR